MKLTENQKKTILYFIIGTVIIVSLFMFSLEDKDKTIVNFFTLFGTFASIFGLWIAYIQIISLKLTNEQTKIAVENSLNKINQLLSISELSKAIKIIQEIQTSNINGKHEVALIRMKDLKSILIQIKYNSELNIYTETNIYNQNITDISIDINNLNDFLIGRKKGLNFSKLNSNLEELSTTITEFENKLKFEVK
ncbi:Probable transmembrane protein of unknown function [Flavobacterium indicum GPTSA100-9 = DSM 17447]|uniref:Uncharacterized protein n=1 Tax=Flavobacterium indicum (strain DSM 17447 / CIP 109464 / GPTSA100-9) TaxID=1094466 RepID=H8XTW7_FLAIG|nr:hypothetical protein [Flavobacterium indicum]CCG53697.1 Probable transmembrane protein of unknown function [Flavobacterium indicum GPTSA100-9 = DSM 17447]